MKKADKKPTRKQLEASGRTPDPVRCGCGCGYTAPSRFALKEKGVCNG
jgi:hypothetical protein